jgi:hypothetical protein
MAARYALDCAPYKGVNSAYKRPAVLQVVLTFVNGVPTIDTARSATGFTIAGDTGVYTGTAPCGDRGVFWGQCLAATPDDHSVCVKSYVPRTGAFAFDVHNAAAAVDVATGNEVWLFFMIEGG